jgi:phosphoenolpyruvate carboxykinase (ATP)
MPSPPPPSGPAHAETGRSPCVAVCLFPNGDRGAIAALRKQFVAQQGPRRAQSPPARIVTHSQALARLARRSHPGALPALAALAARQGAGGMLSSLPIGRGRAGGPTSIYTRTPLPRVRQDARPLAISTSRSPSLVSPVFPAFPSTRWITCTPTLPNWCQLPRPSSAHAPKPPGLERRRKHLRTMKDPVTRTDSPYTDPSVKGPRSQFLTEGHASAAVNSTSCPPPGCPPPGCRARC